MLSRQLLTLANGLLMALNQRSSWPRHLGLKSGCALLIFCSPVSTACGLLYFNDHVLQCAESFNLALGIKSSHVVETVS